MDTLFALLIFVFWIEPIKTDLCLYAWMIHGINVLLFTKNAIYFSAATNTPAI